jgi:alpha-2-macroglobulin
MKGVEMKFKMLISLISLFGLIIISCSSHDTVKVTNFEPLGEVKNLTTFTIEFSDDLAPKDTLNKWLDDEFIEFEPKIVGKFKWTSPSTLIFSPDIPLQSIQSYRARLTNKVLFNKKMILDGEEYEFNTPNFTATKAEFFWAHVPNEKFKVNVKANIFFNYAVNPNMLRDYLRIEREGNPVTNFQIVSENTSDIIAVSIGDVAQTNEEQEYKITVLKGLISVEGKKATIEEKEFEYDLPPITQLAIYGVTAGFDGQKGWVEVSTSQMTDEKRVKEFVTMEPARNAAFFVSENSFRIEGDIDVTQSVNLKIRKGLPGLYGGELENEFEQQVSFVNLNPSISFADKKGKYLMLGGKRNLQCNAVNVSGVDIEISHIFKNNIIHFLNQYGNYYQSDEEYTYDPYYYEEEIEKYGRIIYKESIDLSNKPNWLDKFTISLDQIYNKKLKGVFVAQAMSTEDRWVYGSKIVALTDFGIIAKKSESELMVFVNSISSTSPVEGVEINLISSNNQTLLTGKTNNEGIVKFTNIEENLKNFNPRVITAEKGDDFNYIDLQETSIETSRFDVGGQTSFSSGMKTFLYGDRNLYRPGEQVNITGIVRDDDTRVVKEAPVIIKIITPTGKIFDEYKKILNKEGAFEINFSIPEYALTGEYRAEVYTGAGKLIGSYNFSVEDFVPDKIRVQLTNDKKTANAGENVKIGVEAEYLFGAKASGLRYEANIQMKHRTFISSKYPSFDFGNSTLENSKTDAAFVDGKLDEKGKTEISYTIPADIVSSGIATVYSFVSVFDLTGRTVNRMTSFDVYPQKYYLGIKSRGYYFSTNDNINFQLIALDKDENVPSSYSAMAKLVRYDWQTVLKKDNSDRFYYASDKKEVTLWEKEIDLSGGEKNLPVIVTQSGEYELRVYRKGENNYQRKEFYAYGWGTSTVSSFEVNKEGRIEIVFDKQVYEPGENAKILFTTPFAGKMLITFERNGIYEYKYVEVKERSTELIVSLKEKYIPNVYVTATLFKKHTFENTTPFLVGHGFASLKVERKSLKLPVVIEAPQKVKPNTKVEVLVKTSSGGDVYVTLAAVDEGILQIKNYLSPDPYGFMYAKRALGIQSYDLYKLLLPEILAMKSSPGGDQLAAQLQKRTNPITTKRYNLVAIWSGIKKTDANGIVNVPINIPQFNGEVRLMAVAYSQNKFGSAESKMKVADDLIMEPQIPRFLAPNDSLVMPITLINTTNKAGSVNVSVNVDGPIKVTTSKSQSVTVPANGTALANFALSTWNEIGKGKIVIEASGIAKISDEVNIAIRPISPFIVETTSGSLKGGDELKLDIQNNFLNGTKSTQITLSKFPAVQFAKHLKYLVGYPHGCIEQTVSKLFPQLYFEDLAKLVAPQFYKTNNPIYYVKEGIKKLESMQLYDGSLSYWPGGTDNNWWGSVYAAHFLVEAKKAGFDISESMMSKLLNYLSKKSREKSTFDYYTYNNNSRTVIKIANKEILYSLYVLALAGKGDISTMNYYKTRPEITSADSKYLLAGAFALMGKWDSYYEMLPLNYKSEKTDRLTSGSFDSEARANAIMLNVLIEVEPNNKQIPFIVKYLSKMINDIYSTQERAFTFIGLGKAARIAALGDVKVDVIADGKVIGSTEGKDLSLKIDNGYKSVVLKSQGQGEIYYFLNSEGVKTGNVKETDSRMSVRRNYIDFRTGKEITNGSFSQGQLIVCKISLAGKDNSADNIAITDLIPSGFEIENTRLSSSPELQNYQSTLAVQYMDVRDDRLILFTNMQSNDSKTFYYMLRVVNKGRFTLPVIGAEAMYDPEFNSTNGKGKVRVN